MRVRGLEVNIVERGAVDGRLPVLWGHPLTSSIAAEDRHRVFAWWDTADGRRVIRYDARGHGGSTGSHHAADYRWDNLAHDQRELLDALGIDRVVLGGASMGAATALHTAVQEPDRVAGLLLVIPPTAWQTRSGQSLRYRAAAGAAMTVGVHAVAAGTRRLPDPAIFCDALDCLRHHALADFDAFHRRQLAAAFRGAAGSDLPAPEALTPVADVPTLILAWDTDHAHPVRTATELAACFAHVDLHVARTPDEVAQWPEVVGHFLADFG